MLFARRHTILALVAAGAATMLLAGCGSDSSGPKGPTAAQDAAHYDSIASALKAINTSSATDQSEFVEIFNGVIADGVLPTTTTVTVNGTSGNWFADFANLVDSAGTDSEQVITFWSSTTADTGVLMAFSNGSPEIVQDIVVTGDIGGGIPSTITGSFGTPSGSCSFTSITNVYGIFPDYDPAQSTCQHQSATGTVSVTFGTTSTVTDSIQTFAISSQTANGVRLQFTTSAAFSRAVAKALAKSPLVLRR